MIKPLDIITHNSKVLLVTNPKIAGLYLKYILPKIKAKELFIHCVNDGEKFKNMQTITEILEVAFEYKLDRNSIMIALGGGVITDLVGFASGIYQRGIDFISIPTTLLAQVDASVGGKSGVNNNYGKNLIGIFHQPKVVYIDSLFLETLSKRELNAGIAEIIKMAICFDKNEFYKIKNTNLYDINDLKKIIQKAIQIKANIVAQDEKEKGIRATLNYGHTFAHAIENLTNYKRFLHGEAVGIGMLMANELACNLSLITEHERNEIKEILDKYNLNLDYKIKDYEQFYTKLFLDKKSKDGKLTFILPNGIGNVSIINDISKNQILEALNSWIKNEK